MHIPFYKYQGTGNDFVIIDNRQELLRTDVRQLAPKLCHRRVGIGSDGLILLQDHPEYDFEMIYYNADGSQSVCGNGMRCAVHLARALGLIDQTAHLLTTDGAHRALIQEDIVHVALGDVAKISAWQQGYLVQTGSPHYVQWIHDGWADLDVAQQGGAIRYHPTFQPKGINANFIRLEKENTLFVRTYERGVDAETLSCGTGATAAALVAASTQGLASPVSIQTLGGNLQVSFDLKGATHFHNIYLAGPAQKVFQGTIDIHL